MAVDTEFLLCLRIVDMFFLLKNTDIFPYILYLFLGVFAIVLYKKTELF